MDLKSSAENVTMHGFGRITGSKSFVIRSFWLVLMFGFSAMCMYQLVTIVSKYFGNLSTVKDETLIASEFQFPAITLCGPAYSRWKLSKYAQERNISITPSDDYMDNYGADKQNYGFEVLSTILLTKENLEQVSPNEDEFLLKNLKTCVTDSEKCNYTTDVEKLLIYYRSYCYRFNHQGKFKQKRAGALHGFHVILFLNISDTEPWSFIEAGDAVEVMIQSHEEYPFPDSGTILSPVGHLSQIEIHKSEITRMKAPYPSNCTNGEHSNLIFPGVYSTVSCVESCYTYFSAKECNTAEFHGKAFLSNGSRLRPMTSLQDVACSFGVYDRLVESKFSSCNCNLPCKETKFHKSVSYSVWPATSDLPFYKKVFSRSLGLNSSTMTDEYVRRNFMKISVFFGDMTYRKLTEERKYTLENLISNTGGQMGIWLGASMFSIIELLCLLCQFLYSMFEAKGKVQESAPMENQAAMT